LDANLMPGRCRGRNSKLKIQDEIFQRTQAESFRWVAATLFSHVAAS